MDFCKFVGVPSSVAIRIRSRIRIRMFLNLPDPHPDPLVTCTDPEPDPSIIMQNSKKNLDFYSLVTSLGLFIVEE